LKGSSDEESLRLLCENHLYMKLPTKQYVTKRLGVSRSDGLPRRLLVLLQSESTVTDLLSRAKIVRQSADEYVANSVFINRDLSPLEAQTAYEKRWRRHHPGQPEALPPPPTKTVIHNSGHTVQSMYCIVLRQRQDVCSLDLDRL